MKNGGKMNAEQKKKYHENAKKNGVYPYGNKLPEMKLTEAQIQSQILQWLTLMKIFHWRQNTGATTAEYRGVKRYIQFGFPGVSDILGLLPGGRFLAIEVKSRKGKVSDDQKAFLQSVNESGGLGIVARCVEDVYFLREEIKR